MAKKKSKRKRKDKRSEAGVPRRNKGESLVSYHDRLAELIAQAEKDGDAERSKRLQRKAGRLAHEHERVARQPRKRDAARAGPGSYPWFQCVEEQTKQARGAPHHLPSAAARERANKICGRIRATSRKLYPTYWDIREGRSGNPKSDGHPYAGIALDGGPRTETARDLVVVVDKGGTILDLHSILGEHSFSELDSKYPGLPIFGPFQVLASNIREIHRKAARGTPEVEIR